ncbi:MAG TPA: hypothetical protein PLD19_01010 [Luteimonas sp.]|nr:hypothetical protein [Luteimonas sp.]
MDTTMELDDLKRAWQTLGLQLETTQALQWELLRERKLDKARRHLRPLIWGQLLQLALGIGLIVLGVACWTRNTDVPGLLATGIIVHAFGVVTAAMAGLTIALAGSIDYSAPVLRIQKRMALLLRFQTLNSNLCGLPWWVMWVLVVIAFSGLGEVDPAAGTPPWIAISLGIGVAGLLGTWAWSAWRGKRGARTKESGFSVADGADGIRRGRQLIEEIARFERD